MSERIIAVDVMRAVALFGIIINHSEFELARAWLARFTIGPVEWLWRALTYFRLRPQPATA